MKDDVISRQAAIDLVRDVCNVVMNGCVSRYDPETKDEVYEDIREVDAILKCNKEIRKALKGMPSAQQDCTECAEYDHERHYCQKYCDVIRRTLEEAKQERTGRWIKTARWGRVYYCDQCRNYLDFGGVNAGRGSTNFCPNCGARMEGE